MKNRYPKDKQAEPVPEGPVQFPSRKQDIPRPERRIDA